MKILCRWLAIAALIPLLCHAGEDPGASSPAQSADAAAQFESTLHYRNGKIDLASGFASFALSDRFRFLDAEDARKLLVQAWGNPPDAVKDVLGMVLRADVSPLARDGWAVVITYQQEGYVKDDDAAGIDYDKLLKDMQTATEEQNKERSQQGYPTAQLVGWAERPHYDAAAHKLYWAKDLRFSGAKEDTLNYDIRVLGRQGVLSLNAVAGMGQLEQVKSDMQQVLAFTEFSAGHRYAEFNGSTDKVAAYGIGALIAGGVAAKMGLFAKLGLLLLGMKKALVFIVAGAGAVIAKLFKRKGQDS